MVCFTFYRLRPTSHLAFFLLQFLPPLQFTLKSHTTPYYFTPTMTISQEKRELIVSQHRKGMPSKDIADNLEVPLSTVNRILLLYRKRGDVTPKISPGRPRLLTPRDEREIVLTIRRAPSTRPSTLTHSLRLVGKEKVSTQTVRRTLVRSGLRAYRMRRKPRLTAAQRQARLKWAEEYIQKPSEFWDSVIFSDESSFHTHEAQKGRYVWRFPHEELEPPVCAASG